MKRLFRLSKRVTGKIKFQLIHILKWFILLTKKNKNIEKQIFEYYRSWHAENSFLIVHIKFKNAIYFLIDNNKYFNLEKLLIFDLEKLNKNEIKIEIFGFRQSKVFTIDIKKEIHLNTKPFNTLIQNINTFEIGQQKTNINTPTFQFKSVKPSLKSPHIIFNSDQIQVKFNKFKTQDFI